MNLGPTRILVVDDSALYRQSINNVLRELQGVSVVGAAKNGVEALEKIEKLDPDLLTLDVQMPDMDGIQLLRELRKRRLGPSVIMVSSYTAKGAQVTTEALMEGAFDFILKPSSKDAVANRRELLDSLAAKIGTFRESARARRSRSVCAPSEAAGGKASTTDTISVPRAPSAPCKAVIIGASTGGPEALKIVLPKLAKELRVPVLVVQHMPPKYTSSLASRLDLLCPLDVEEATDGVEVEAGKVLLAPGGRQMRLEREGSQTIVRISDDAPENGVRPSVDYLIRSANEMYKGNVLAVIMTGMGRDGLTSCQALKEAGGYVFAQGPEDCIVYGMPKAVIDAELADRVLSLGRIAPAISRHVNRSRRSASGDRA